MMDGQRFRGPVRPPVTVVDGGLSIRLGEVEPVTAAEAIAALGSEQCVCGSPKQRGQALCRFCFYAVHPMIQCGLYWEMGKGFERAYAGALLWLAAKAEQTRHRKETSTGEVSPELELKPGGGA